MLIIRYLSSSTSVLHNMRADDVGAESGGAGFVFADDVAAGVGGQAAGLPDEALARDADEQGPPDICHEVTGPDSMILVF